ncbi:hypothetical protein D2Q93_07895 [Alicyclobacillaceae bacterium I2511]|nr:hypothetical protein D2Q93_07895 [Alicyclobacillaceae bacterium I2511]
MKKAIATGGGRSDKFRTLVTVGLLVGYAILIRQELIQHKKTSVVANGILLPTSLVWLWFVH